ncbi:MAG: SDR family NAD(P)-dependent oxidoreductase [Candidatus Thorarchaeota archaeon]
MDIENKTILITGSDGFVGSHLVQRFLEENCTIRAFVLYNSLNRYGWLDTIENKQLKDIKIIAGDIRDYNLVKKAVKGVDIVCHLAALIGIPYSYVAPESYIDTNAKGTLNIVHAAKENNLKKVIITSTSETYGSALYTPIDEKHPYQPQSPYSASKVAADAIALSYFYSFKTPVSIIRPFNIYGPRQSTRAIIPTIITQILKKDEIDLGNLSPKRDFTYVKDTCEAYIKLIRADNVEGEIINIGTAKEISIQDLALKIKQLMHSNAEIKSKTERKRIQTSEVDLLKADNTKALKLINWKPTYSLEEGLKFTIDWFSKKENLDLYKLGYTI